MARVFDCSLQDLDNRTEDPSYLLTLVDRTADTRSEQQLLHDVFHDRLTQLPNSAMFVLRASEWLDHRRARENGVVMMINLNRFQMINESLGHESGDQLLVAVAQRMTDCLPKQALIARMGGDEFAVLLPRTAPGDEGFTTAQSLHEALSAPLTIDNHDLRVTASIGIAQASALNAAAEDLVKNSSIAMHRAKREGRGRTVLYHNDLTAHAKSRFEFEGDLRRALERGELSLHYQPIYSLASGELTGFEALCRWQHPERGAVPPVDFIAIAEASGLIIPLGRWALHAACAQLADWSARYPVVSNLSVNVNVSGLQISGDNMAAVVREALIASGIAGNRLRLEITESALMTNADLAADLLLDLKSFGVCLALDDFGTGYSSLNYLSRFPIDTIKIDRSFIAKLDSNPDDAKIVHIITQLASSLGISAVAEGIETLEHLERLKVLGCHYGQGYYFSRPLPAAAVENQLFS
nr:bifunctional diguanylate cyclase/phosphodiesterase [Govania unica]